MPPNDIRTVIALRDSKFTPGSKHNPIAYTNMLEVLHKTVELETVVDDKPEL